MRHARLTWPGALHHVMNRGQGGERVFASDALKEEYLEILQEEVAKFHIPIFAYCLMDNHFHLVLRNESGSLSRFMQAVHTRYGFQYHKSVGGRGYVFQDRYKSTLIQDDGYLFQALLYVLNNPVRAGLVRSALDYPWSSAGAYFADLADDWLSRDLVESMMASQERLRSELSARAQAPLPERVSRFGWVLGGEAFAAQAEKRFDRRRKPDERRNGRGEDRYWAPVEQVFGESERRIGKPVERIDTGCHEGKRQRAELLVLLRDQAGLTYREIMEFEVFRGLSLSSLGSVYAGGKRKRKEKAT